MNRRSVPLALALAVLALGSTAVAGTLSMDRSAVTPVEQYRSEALARTGTSTTGAESRAGETPASSKGFAHVF